jgi:hypothetical protein
MGWFQRRRDETSTTPASAPDRHAAATRIPEPDTDWADLENVRAEWQGQLEPEAAARLGWNNGSRMFVEGVVPGQRLNVAEYLTRGLAYHLFTPILTDDDALVAAKRVLTLVDQIPDQPAFLADLAPRLARLALAVIRQKGWQPSQLGGDDSVTAEILNARPDGLVLYSARCPGVPIERTWSNFFGDRREQGEVAEQGGGVEYEDSIAIWDDPDVRQICDFPDEQPLPRFFEFNDHPDQLRLVVDFVQRDAQNGEGTSAQSYVDACLAGIRAVEALDSHVHPGWIKFFVCQVDRNNSLLWDQHHQPREVVSAVAEWIVTFIERHGWGPDGRSTPLGQRHGNALAVMAEAGDAFTEHRDGARARLLAGVNARPRE